MATEADLIQKFKDLNIPVGTDFEELIHEAFTGANLVDKVENHDSRITTVEDNLDATKDSIQSNTNQIATKADDSKVVHSADTSNWQKSKVTDDAGMPLLMLGDTDDLSAKISTLPNGYFTIYCSTKTLNNPSAFPKRGIIHVTASKQAGSGILFSEDKNAYIITMLWGTVTYTQIADDNKVAHLSGANNFDTVPTVNNNPLLLASSLPSDLARTSQQTNFTDGLQKGGKDVATVDEVADAKAAAITQALNDAKAEIAKLPKHVTLTQAQFDALATKDANTYYYITAG